MATAPIRPLAWEPPYGAGAALEMAKRQKQNKTKQKPLKKRFYLFERPRKTMNRGGSGQGSRGYEQREKEKQILR